MKFRVIPDVESVQETVDVAGGLGTKGDIPRSFLHVSQTFRRAQTSRAMIESLLIYSSVHRIVQVGFMDWLLILVHQVANINYDKYYQEITKMHVWLLIVLGFTPYRQYSCHVTASIISTSKLRMVLNT